MLNSVSSTIGICSLFHILYVTFLIDRVYVPQSYAAIRRVHTSLHFASNYSQQSTQTFVARLAREAKVIAGVVQEEVLTGFDSLNPGADVSLQHRHDCAKETNVESGFSCSN